MRWFIVTDRFNEIYYLYNNDVYRLVFSYLLSNADTEDVIQRVFIKLYNNKKILSLTNEEIKKWLFKVSINEAKDILKSPWRKLMTKLTDNDNSIVVQDDSLISALNNIKPIYRIPLYLYYYEGYSIKEIAIQMHKSESSIKMRLARGKEDLKKEMEGVK